MKYVALMMFSGVSILGIHLQSEINNLKAITTRSLPSAVGGGERASIDSGVAKHVYRPSEIELVRDLDQSSRRLGQLEASRETDSFALDADAYLIPPDDISALSADDDELESVGPYIPVTEIVHYLGPNDEPRSVGLFISPDYLSVYLQ